MEGPSSATDNAVSADTLRPLRWIGRDASSPYFATEDGDPWTPIGYNDAIPWLRLRPLLDRRDPKAVDGFLADLADHGVNCLRLMLEYSQHRGHYLEDPPGVFQPRIVQFWDDLVPLCERHGVRLLLTPYDTYWMWMRWSRHPYNVRRGGVVAERSALLTDPAARQAIKNRLSFATRRWGGSGAIFAWDLWNELHPALAGDSADGFMDLIADLSAHLRAEELQVHGRAHLQTVSMFGPELRWRAHMPLKEPIFHHRDLDFATLHIYAERRIDAPRNTVDAAAAMAEIVAESLAEIVDGRPFLDTEHGPIHSYKDRRRSLPAAFDEEYFRHMQWAHLASGGAGGGMRWPNRNPHVLTPGMHRAQRALARFAAAFDWRGFDRRNLAAEIDVRDAATGRALRRTQAVRCGCRSSDRAIVYLVRRDALDRCGMIDRTVGPRPIDLRIAGWPAGGVTCRLWNVDTGDPIMSWRCETPEGVAHAPLLLFADLLLTLEVEQPIGRVVESGKRIWP